MTKKIIKTFNGYAVTYHSDRKFNRFVITDHGKVVEKYADFRSCMEWLYSHVGNLETLGQR